MHKIFLKFARKPQDIRLFIESNFILIYSEKQFLRCPDDGNRLLTIFA